MDNDIQPIGTATGDATDRDLPVVIPRVAQGNRLLALLLVAVVVLVALIAWSIVDGDDAAQTADPSLPGLDPTTDDARRLDAARIVQQIPQPLLAAELFAAEPGAEGLRELFTAVGGFEGLTIATATGSFDMVRFDPTNADRLLATHRSSYGDAENQDRNEVWKVDGSEIVQRVWAPAVSHDFAHFNRDGTITRWSHGGGPGFAPRVATIVESDFTGAVASTGPIYASRFAATRGTVFTLTGDGDYYSNEVGYLELRADSGGERTVLARVPDFGWIDNPTPNLLIAFPDDEVGSTAVWDANTLEPLSGHALAGRRLQGVGVSGVTAVAATSDGRLEVIDLTTGTNVTQFGRGISVAGVDQPIALGDDGLVAVTVERDGLVSIWWVGDSEPIARVQAESAQPRWVSERYAARSTSVIAADASKVALRVGARPGVPTQWQLVDTDPDGWIERACLLADRELTAREASALGLKYDDRTCR